MDMPSRWMIQRPKHKEKEPDLPAEHTHNGKTYLKEEDEWCPATQRLSRLGVLEVGRRIRAGKSQVGGEEEKMDDCAIPPSPPQPIASMIFRRFSIYSVLEKERMDEDEEDA
ncbi:unnamed protein product [Caenorhabditis brenneri]